MTRLTVFACDSHPIAIEGLSKVLGASDDLELVGSAGTLREALEAIRQLRPNVLLVDQSSGLKVVFQFLADVRNICDGCQPVLWVNDLAEVDCFRALQLGARGILKKTFPVSSLLECIRSVGQGNIWIASSFPDHGMNPMERRSIPRLTPREREIMHHICDGLKNKEIAAALAITAGTVKVHLMHIFEKTGVKDRFELAVHGRRMLGAEQAGGASHSQAQRGSAA